MNTIVYKPRFAAPNESHSVEKMTQTEEAQKMITSVTWATGYTL